MSKTLKKKDNPFISFFWILIIALIFRAFAFQSYNIPSGSMLKNLFVGDYIFVSKFAYGYSKNSLPFSLPIIPGRIFSSSPKRGDVVVFKTPADNRTDYVKRLIGLPGDLIQFKNGNLYINNNEILKDQIDIVEKIYCGSNKFISVNTYLEKLPNGKNHKTAYRKKYSFQNSDKFLIPKKQYFFLGDNRDCSKDSRFLSSVGYVHENNLVGKAQFIFFSSDNKKGQFYQFWKWHKILRFNRFFKKII